MELECPVCYEDIEIESLHEGKTITCPACGSDLELQKEEGEWELWEIDEDEL